MSMDAEIIRLFNIYNNAVGRGNTDAAALLVVAHVLLTRGKDNGKKEEAVVQGQVQSPV